ncbi:tRNA (adenine57-N1/adenine58-N1)-methyltransferase [Persephonella hydrogeniphila]|uniref:tRNA (adenine(58)-N(1))-methyltransferase TrmI n=1 Tax=Persephonella hydrogeniphila TaxID=198703 RepID=A0A285MZ59_9AQUI|nr:tRNA (adenine-N1)-methyltransferase [Persephonella hydrogeniphila]SNZ02472.1 tRNA (adenine57-N1/adenine58-N1)-methyltransferase [Persephonella hydrogeniphila]
MIKEGDTVQLSDGKNRFFLKVKKGEVFGTHRGNINHEDIIKAGFGGKVKTHKGHTFVILRPTLHDIIMFGIKRKTQIIYPKDSSYITLKLGITDGMKVLESGVGSGGLTIVMANAVKPSGKIYCFEKEEKYIKNAYENIKLAGLENYVEIKHQSLEEPLPENFFDAGFIDVREPWLYIENIKQSLKIGSPIGFLVPTTNQVTSTLESLKKHKFIDLEVVELLERHYKPVPERLRPEDRMVAHTGYLIFGRNS